MILPAQAPVPHAAARLLTVGPDGDVRSRRRDDLADLLLPGDLLIANDAATIPASLTGSHERSDAGVEIRLAGRPSLRPDDVRRFVALALGAGDWHTPTEDRASGRHCCRGIAFGSDRFTRR